MPILNPVNAGDLAQLLVAFRFLEAGRPPAWPLTVQAYDLLVDAGDAIFRVQVKKATQVDGPDNWAVVLQKRNPIPSNAFDYLAVWCDYDRSYVIPAGAICNVADPTTLVARVQIAVQGQRFVPYLNRFNIGSGEPRPMATLAPGVSIQHRRFWFESKRGNERKAHKRLTTAEIEELRRLPIRWFKYQENAEGLIPIEQIAQQFGITVTTARNYLRGKRKDLKPLA